MSKGEKLDRLMQIILEDCATPPEVYTYQIFYGDCGCEYTDPKGASYGWHLTIELRNGLHGRYLGKNYKQAFNRLNRIVPALIKAARKTHPYTDREAAADIPF